MIQNMKTKNKTVSRDFSLNPQGVLYKKVQDYGKEFKALLMPKELSKYVLFESHNSLVIIA